MYNVQSAMHIEAHTYMCTYMKYESGLGYH